MKTKFYLLVAIATLLLTGCESEPNEPAKNTEDYLNRSFTWTVDLSLELSIGYTDTINIGNDTVIEGKTYRLVDDYYPMRQDNYAIYMYDRYYQKEVLLYDFSLKVGDSIEQLEDPYGGTPARYAKVSKTETITLADGRKAKRIEYERTYPAPRDPDIEFVGNERRGILGPLDNMLHSTKLKAFYDNNILLFPIPRDPKDCDGEIQRLNALDEPSDTYDCLQFLDNYGPNFQTAYEKLQPEINDFLEEMKQKYNRDLWDTDKAEIRLTKRNVRNSPKEDDVEYTSLDVYMFNISHNDYCRQRNFRVIDSDGDVYTISY